MGLNEPNTQLRDSAVDFQRLLEITEEVNNGWRAQDGLILICKAGVELFEVDHSALVVFQENDGVGIVTAEYPEGFRALGGTVDTDVPAEEQLLRTHAYIHFPDLNSEESRLGLGSVHAELWKRGIRAILIVPVVRSSKVIASLSLDSKTPREFDAKEILKLSLLASIGARSIERVRGEDLNARIVEALNADVPLDQLKARVIATATRLLNARSAQIYEYPGDDRLVQSMAAERAGAPGPAAEADCNNTEPNVIRTLIGIKDRIRGVLAIELPAEHKVTLDDFRVADDLARYAYVVLDRAEAVEREKFLRKASDIASATDDWRETLSNLTREAARFFDGCFCRIVAIDSLGTLLNDVASTPFAAVRLNGRGGHTNTIRLLRSITKDPLLVHRDGAEVAPLLNELEPELARLQPEVAWVFPLSPTAQIQAWFIVAFRGEQNAQESFLTASEFSRRIGNYIARVHLQQTEQRQQQLILRLNQAFAQHREDLDWNTQSLEIPQIAARILDASGAALIVLRRDAGRLIRISEYHTGEVTFPFEVMLTPALIQIFTNPRPALLENRSEALGSELAGRLGPVVIAPLRVKSPDLTHALVLWREPGREYLEEFSRGELDILEIFGLKASAVLSRAPDGWQLERSHFALLAEFAEFALAEDDPTRIYRAALTAITADYGLRFNRAAILFLSGGDAVPQLYGEEAVGSVDKEEAGKEWTAFRSSNVTTFRNYLEALRLERAPHSPLQSRITAFRMPAKTSSQDPFSEALGGTQVVRPGMDFAGPFRRVWYGEVPGHPVGDQVAVVPLYTAWPPRIVGLLVADNWHSGARIDDSQLPILAEFGSLAVEAAYSRRGKEARLESVPPIPRGDPDTVLNALIGQIRRTFDHSGVAIIIADERKRARWLLTQGMDMLERPAKIMRLGGHSQRVLESGLPVIIEDRRLEPEINQNVSSDEFRGSVCLPLEDGISRLGVVWLHTVSILNRHDFEHSKLPALSAEIRRYAAAYRIAWQNRDQAAFNQARSGLNDVRDPRKAERAILKSCCELFDGNTCFLFPIDTARQQFSETRLLRVEKGGTDVVVDTSEQMGLRPNTISVVTEAFRDGYAKRENVPNGERSQLPSKVESMEAAVLKAGEAGIAVLLLCYPQPRILDASDRDRLVTFAQIASSCLHSARLTYTTDQRLREADWLRLVDNKAQLNDNLDRLAVRIRQETAADKIMLFSYDHVSRTFEHPPGGAGLQQPHEARGYGKVRSDSFVYRFGRRGEPVYVFDVSARNELAESRFVRDEQPRSVAVLPLGLPHQPLVGIVFLNFTDPQFFDQRQREDLEAVAGAVTEAVRASQIYANQLQLVERLNALVTLPKKFSQSESSVEASQIAVSEAAQLLDVEFANIILINPDGNLRQEAAFGWDAPYTAGHVFAVNEAQHARYTIKRGSDTPVDDFRLVQSFDLPPAITEREIRSGLGVPVSLEDGRVIGAMLVHTIEARHFDETDRFFLRMLATEAAYAHERLRLEHSKQKKLGETQTELAWVSRQSMISAHQLTEPLNYLSNVIDLALDNHFGPIQPRLAFQLDIARGGLRNSWRVAQNILGRELLGSLPPSSPAPARVAPLLRGILDRWHRQAQAGAKSIQFDHGNTISELALIDDFSLTLVVENMVANAVQAASKGGTIELKAVAKNDQIRIEVIDDGPGLHVSIRNWIVANSHDPIPTPPGRATGRLGKGLEITRDILAAYGGRLEVPAVAGQGCLICAVVPRWFDASL